MVNKSIDGEKFFSASSQVLGLDSYSVAVRISKCDQILLTK